MAFPGCSGMASGVGIDDECMHVFDEVKMGHRYLYVIYKISDDYKKIIVEERAGHEKTYNDFVETMKAAEAKRQCRYAIFDVRFMHGEVPQEKLAFFLWSPDKATVKQKMLYTSSKLAFKAKLRGVHADIQCTDESDLIMTNILERVCNKYT
jgi:cofilin